MNTREKEALDMLKRKEGGDPRYAHNTTHTRVEPPVEVSGSRQASGIDKWINAHHKEWCACLPNSKAQRHLGQCYCNCGAEENENAWVIVEEVDGSYVFPSEGYSCDDFAFGRVRPICKMCDPADLDNARLIAAAPELLEACKRIDADMWSDVPPILQSAMKVVRAAIAKAEGK